MGDTGTTEVQRHMNGVHDLGGMQGFGPVVREQDEPVLHTKWEKRVLGLQRGFGNALGTLDAFRHAIERMNPVEYLRVSYYERWLAGMERRAKDTGILTEEEIRTGIPSAQGRATKPPLPPSAVRETLLRRPSERRPQGRRKPRFEVGAAVVARQLHAGGHTRLPRYVRGKQGVVEHVHGNYVFPDANAHGLGENPQPLYSVCFEATTLWGPEAPREDRLYIDLWEDYLREVDTQ